MIIFQPGDTFAGRFRLEQKIGQGGMGQVWRATQLALGRRVALKLILPTVDGDERFRALFLAEAQISASLMHPNLVPVVDFGEEEHGVLWLVQVFVDGCDLGAVLRRAPEGLPLPLVGHIVHQVLLALQAAHQGGVIHRDLKPGNVLVSRAGDILLTDFGIAKLLAPGQDASRSTVLKGSPGYLAPEILRGEAPRFASDLFAVGALAYELISGRNPFMPTGAERDQIFLSTLTTRPAPLYAPERWNAFVQRLLEKDPQRRPGTAAAALEELHRLLAPIASEATSSALGRFLATTAETVVAPLPPMGQSGGPPASAPAAAERPPRPRLAMAGAVGILMMMGLAALALVRAGAAPAGSGERRAITDGGPGLARSDAGARGLAAPGPAADAGAERVQAGPDADAGVAPVREAVAPRVPDTTPAVETPRPKVRRPAWEVQSGRAPEVLTPR